MNEPTVVTEITVGPKFLPSRANKLGEREFKEFLSS